ncbi:MAG: hypothetical protein R2713_22860 [Ilumatobacteraceae bacterium]
MDYGRYEGLRIDEIREDDPTWNVFVNGGLEGENAPGGRTPRVVHRKLERGGRACRGRIHARALSRMLTARMLGLHAAAGESLWKSTPAAWA